jgi:hypothetical protein
MKSEMWEDDDISEEQQAAAKKLLAKMEAKQKKGRPPLA